MSKRALVIGINYNYMPRGYKLRGCINDANNVVNFLVNKCGYKSSDVILMTDEGKNKHTDLFPRRKHVMDQIQKLLSLTKSGDTLFMHFSGHGTEMRDTNGDEADGKDSAIITAKGSCIIDDEIKEQFVNKMPVGSKLRIVMDCCHSGTMGDLPYNWRGGSYTRESSDVQGSTDCIMLSGCADPGTSADAYISKQFSGALTAFMLQILTPNNNYSWQEFLAILRHVVRSNGYKQEPQLSIGDKDLIHRKVDI
jgi:hypothetical protein